MPLEREYVFALCLFISMNWKKELFCSMVFSELMMQEQAFHSSEIRSFRLFRLTRSNRIWQLRVYLPVY